MMLLEQYPVDGIFYKDLASCQEMLRREGWKEFHAGNWRNSNNSLCRGMNRDIRKQPEGFIVYQSQYVSR